jgi:hypothetical protein
MITEGKARGNIKLPKRAKKYRIKKCLDSSWMCMVQRKFCGLWIWRYSGDAKECERYIERARNPIVKEYS